MQYNVRMGSQQRLLVIHIKVKIRVEIIEPMHLHPLDARRGIGEQTVGARQFKRRVYRNKENRGHWAIRKLGQG